MTYNPRNRDNGYFFRSTWKSFKDTFLLILNFSYTNDFVVFWWKYFILWLYNEIVKFYEAWQSNIYHYHVITVMIMSMMMPYLLQWSQYFLWFRYFLLQNYDVIRVSCKKYHFLWVLQSPCISKQFRNACSHKHYAIHNFGTWKKHLKEKLTLYAAAPHTNCLNVFDNFVGLPLKGLTYNHYMFLTCNNVFKKQKRQSRIILYIKSYL